MDGNECLNNIFKKIKKNGIEIQDKLPLAYMEKDGKCLLHNGGSWTDGFFIGIANLAYVLTNDEEFRRISEQYDCFLNLRIQNTNEINEEHGFLKLDHDVGMIFLPSVGLRYTCFKREEDKAILLKAADILAERFNEKGNFIRAWDTWKTDTDINFIEEKKGKVIVDSLMNIPLLFQVSELTGNQRYYEIAEKHADTVAAYIVREDFSTYHTYNFDYRTGKPICGKTRQGYSDDSCWSRGQAWAAYGFALAYKYTKKEKFLQISIKLAEYFMNHLSGIDIPCWDFSTADMDFSPWDSSASAICASGLLELWELTGEGKYKEDAIRLLNALETFCLTDKYENCQPLLLHGCVGPAYQKEKPDQINTWAIDRPLIYGDYFYLECKLKLSDCKLRVF